MIVQDGRPDDFFSRLKSRLLMELHVDSSGKLGLGRCGYELSMEAASESTKSRHDTLHIDNHGIRHACGHSQLLAQEVAGHGHALTHECLISSAA